MILVDGSCGERGGQILRTASALWLVTGKAFCIESVRAKGEKPGLRRQHLTAVKAPTEVGQAQVEEDAIGSSVDLMERGDIIRLQAVGIVPRIPRKIAKMEVAFLKTKLSWPSECFRVEDRRDCRGPGNIVICTIESRNTTEVSAGFGKSGVPAAQEASDVGNIVQEYSASGVPVGRHLADQLMIPVVLGGGGRFLTIPLTGHSLTNMEVIRKLLDVDITVEKQNGLNWIVEIAEKGI